MAEAETSPRKKRKIAPTDHSDSELLTQLPPSINRMSLSGTSQHSDQDVNVSMSSSSMWPSSSAGSFSSYTTTSTSFNIPGSIEVGSISYPPQTLVSDILKSSSMLEDNLQTQDPSQSLFERVLHQRDILFEVCSWLPAKDLVNLYAVSKNFHNIMNRQITTLIVGNAQARMPESADVFRFKAYKSLCNFDPARNVGRDKQHIVRDTPTLRWLKFLEYREATVNSIIVQLALKSHRLPRCTSKVIKKIWFLMDIPETNRRIGCIHNQQLWSDSDLFLACMFFMKLDMAYTDPILGSGECDIREMLLAQRTLTVMDKVLKREEMRNQYEMLQMFTEWEMDRSVAFQGVTDINQAPRLFFGVLRDNIGSLCGENWTANAPYLMRPDELVFNESIRRGLQFEDKLTDLMLWGHTHPVTRADVHPTNWKGEVQTSFEDEVEKKVEQDIARFLSKEGT